MKKNVILIIVAAFIFSIIGAGCSKPIDDQSSSSNSDSSNTSATATTSSTDESEDATSGSDATDTDNNKTETGNVDNTMTNKNSSTTNDVAKNTTTAKKNTTTTKKPAVNKPAEKLALLGKNIMPIGAWVAPPQANALYPGSPDFISDKYYKAVADSGINIIYGLYERMSVNPSDVIRALDCAGRNNLKYFVSDSGVYMAIDDYEAFQEKIDLYKSKPAYLGNMINDEPAMAEFNQLKSIEAAFKKYIPNKYSYVNLLPAIATKDQLFVSKLNETGGKSTKEDYQKYINNYVSTVKPRIISYDDYPLEGAFPSIRSNYFWNMSTIKHAADAAGIPCWMFVQTCKYNSNNRIPKESEINWLVNTALAYGFQGIQYFTFWLPTEKNFDGAMMTREGVKTDAYYYVQKINKHITQIDDVLMNTDFKGIIVSGKSPDAIPSKDIIKNYGALKSVGGGASMTGCFSYGSKSAYYVVNNNLTQSGEVTLTFNASVNMKIVKQASSSTAKKSTLALSLSPGEGVLVVV